MMAASEKISNVRLFTLAGAARDAALVQWQSGYENMLHQVYVNGILAGATLLPSQRQIIVPIPQASKYAARIEVLAVQPKSAYEDAGLERKTAARAEVSFPITDNLPTGAVVDFYKNDFKQNNRSIKIFPQNIDKGGFGLSSFAKSDFGYDGSSAIGLGRGNFGNGAFGFDAQDLLWNSRQLSAGKYQFKITITDVQGNINRQAAITREITVIPPAQPAHLLAVKAFDKINGLLLLAAE